MRFEDLYPGWDRDDMYYGAPNESTTVWRNLARGLRIERAAAICSGGEVGLLTLLPTVRRELVLVDHSYKSLSIAMIKYLMLRRLGAEHTRRLLGQSSSPDLVSLVNRLAEELPEPVRTAFKQGVGSDGFTSRMTRVPDAIKPHWERVSPLLVKAASLKLDKVVFVHGDICDIAPRGPFDLLYMSNALGHTSRFTDTHPYRASCTRNDSTRMDAVVAMVKPGGYLMVSDSSYPRCGDAVCLKDPGALHGSYSLWRQLLFRRPSKYEARREVAA